MNRMVRIAFKDLKLLLRDRMHAFFIIGFPVLMGLFFGAIMGNMKPSSDGQSRISIGYLDQDRSSQSQKFFDLLREGGKVELVECENLSAARRSVRKGQRVALLVVEKGFAERAGVFWGEAPTIQMGVDPSRAAESAMLQGMIMEAMGELTRARLQDPGLMKDLLEKSRQQLKKDTSVSEANRLLINSFLGSVETMVDSMGALQNAGDGTADVSSGGGGFSLARLESVDVTGEPDPASQRGQIRKLKSKWDISFPQAMLWGVLACSAGFAASVAQERTQGTLTRLQVAPVSGWEIVAGKALGCFLAVIAVILLMTVLGLSLGMRPHSYSMLAMATACVSFCFVGLMMLMSVLGKTEQSVNGAGWAINMVMAMLGGCMIPVMFMPGWMRGLSVVSPVRWAILAIEGAVWREFSWSEMLGPCSVLLLIGILGLSVGGRVFQRMARGA